MKETPRIFKKSLLVGFIVVFLCIASGIFSFLLLNGKGEPANLITATNVTQRFLKAIHSGDMELAHSMLSERFNPPVTVGQFTELIQRDQDIFSTYHNLEICNWGLFVSNGYIIDTSGLLYYGSGIIVVQISLHKDSDLIWRIQGFNFRSDINPTPFGLCQ